MGVLYDPSPTLDHHALDQSFGKTLLVKSDRPTDITDSIEFAHELRERAVFDILCRER
jgi:hypothetical protein